VGSVEGACTYYSGGRMCTARRVNMGERGRARARYTCAGGMMGYGRRRCVSVRVCGHVSDDRNAWEYYPRTSNVCGGTSHVT